MRSRQALLRARRLTAVGASLLLCLVAAGCGLKSANAFIPPAEPGSIEPVESLEGVEITVGSKNFTEQLILGKMAGIILEVAGAEVVDKTNLAGSVASRQAQLSGDVDMVWEYTGTAWITYLGHSTPIPSRIPQWRAVAKEDLAKNGLVWLKPAPMNNTYAFATPEETQRKLGITKLSELKTLSPDQLTFCVESEFFSRSDGFKPMLEKYDMALGQDVPRGNVTILDTGVVYSVTDKGGTCNFGEVFTTDGRILALGLSVLKDDRAFFPLYNVAAVFGRQVLREHPELRDIFERVSREITTETMLRLNAQVDVEGADPALVARDWLRQKGFVN
ncbi:MAG: glycine betaine ABC transporter substrate-binding protein [Actinomycetota bacterium]|nr:glycine betaine ABC transporter substrate-binding protein [Actinomycetota bacterium]